MLNGLTTYHWDRMCQAMRQRWPRLTIEDTSSIAGNLEALYLMLQRHYRLSPAMARAEINDFLMSYPGVPNHQ